MGFGAGYDLQHIRPRLKESMAKNSDNDAVAQAGGGAQWFKFHAVRWLNSPTIQKMTSSERGIYIQILAAIWHNGEVPSDPKHLAQIIHVSNYRTVVRWLSNYSHLMVKLQSNDNRLTSQKLSNLQVLKQKTTADRAGRVEKSREEESLGGVDVLCDVIKPPQKPDQEPTPKPFDPIAYAKELRGEKSGLDANKLTSHWQDVTGHWEYRKTSAREHSNTAFEKLMDGNTEAEIIQVMDYTVQSARWFRGATTVNYQQPWDWFVSKFDQIKAQMQSDAPFMAKLEQEAQKEASAVMKGKLQGVADAKAMAPAAADPLFITKDTGDGQKRREIARKPTTQAERHMLLEERAKPKKNREYFNKFLAQDNCPTCHGTGVECECIEMEGTL